MNLANDPQQALKKKIISLLDLTQLDTDLTTTQVIQLCQKAITPLGNVAAVCIPAHFIALAKQQLAATSILIATVANFPAGDKSLVELSAEIETIIAAGADEVDIVIPYHFYLENNAQQVMPYLTAAINACRGKIKVKVILETGCLTSSPMIARAALDAIAAGANFIKTSTGKVPVGATMAAAEIMLATIKQSKQPVGFKASGGVRTLAQAVEYMALAEKIIHPNWVNAEHFRFGASSLLDELVANGSIKTSIANHY